MCSILFLALAHSPAHSMLLVDVSYSWKQDVKPKEAQQLCCQNYLKKIKKSLQLLNNSKSEKSENSRLQSSELPVQKNGYKNNSKKKTVNKFLS